MTPQKEIFEAKSCTLRAASDRKEKEKHFITVAHHKNVSPIVKSDPATTDGIGWLLISTERSQQDLYLR